MLTKIARNALASFSSLAVSAAVLAAPLPAVAGPLLAPSLNQMALVRAVTSGNASVLGLKGDDAKASEALTAALRTAFAARDMGGGEELSLEEVMLTMGCESKENAACMTEAGQALGVGKLVYGELAKSGSGYTLDIVVLDTGTGMVDAQASAPLTKKDLNKDNVDQTAAEIVSSLFPGNDEEIVTAPPPLIEEPTETTEPTETKPERESDLVWGPYSPRPRWKKVGLGVSASFAIVGLVGAAVTGVLLPGYERTVRDEAQKGRDAGDTNAVGPGGDLCAQALDTDDAGDVFNSAVGTPCRDGNRARILNQLSFGVMALGLAATAVFTTLYFVHRKETPSKASRRRLRMTAGGGRTGFSVGAQARF